MTAPPTGPAIGESFPLSPLDDFPIHQTPDPIRVAATSDPRFFDRHWAVLCDDMGEVTVAIGGTVYPNLGTTEAYVIVNVRGDHRSVRAFRSIGSDRSDLHIGPIRPTVVEGLRRWRFDLGPNEWGIELGLDWTDTHRQVYGAQWGSLTGGTAPGSQRHVTAGFEGFGTAAGWITVDGVRRDVALRGTRDRHWGIGRGVGGPAMNGGVVPRGGWMGGLWFALDSLAIWGNSVLYPLGDERPGRGQVVHTWRRYRFDHDTKLLLAGEIDLVLDDDTTHHLTFERLGSQVLFMRCGLYGGSPDGRFQGEHVGEDVVEGDSFDVRDPAAQVALAGLDEHHCRIRLGDEIGVGIVQPLEPEAYEACRAGRPGWELLA